MIKITRKDRLSSILKESQWNNEINLRQAARKLSVSTRTIRNDIIFLNSELKNVAEFRLEKGNYWLHFYDADKYKDFLTNRLKTGRDSVDTPQERDSALAVRLIEAHEPLKIEELADSLNVGRTTLLNDLKRLRITFESCDLSLNGKPNAGIRLDGSEWKKRIYILQNNIFGTPELNSSIQTLIADFGISNHIEDETLAEWRRYIMVMLRRMHGHHLLSRGSIPNPFSSVERADEFRKVSDFSDRLETKCGYSISKLERLFITLPILGRRSPVNILDVPSAPVPAGIKKLIRDIQRQVKQELNISFDFEKVTRELGYHLMFMMNRLVFSVQLHNSLIEEVKGKYPLAFEMAEIAYDVIYRNYHIKTTEAELGYLAYYFGIMVTEHEERLKDIRRVGIICDTGRSTARIIEVQLRKILSDHVEIQLFSSNTVSLKELENLDIIFSTVLLKSANTPIIHVTDIFDERRLLRKINQLFELKNLHLKTDEDHFSIIGHLLGEDKFFALDEHRTYQENVEKMIGRLQEKGYVDEHFKDRISEREKKSQMIFDNDIAFPHAMIKGKKEIMFALGVFPERIQVGRKTIRLIFLLGVPEMSDENLLVHVYDEMIALSRRSDWIDKISRVTAYPEIKRFFDMEFH
ncbi:PRD domain-containing protein [Sporolactobacillus sp. CQH2019]|uniref:BglG family transcription antiterminator n=1 Tax=Sporolactobacillus sp. CQH2019 TaxID=3023512 RepID=UPI0023676772|nr:PRD domain-containing protein [Sporolactobacillus sp. CQH2019]MDD9148977.1 PRD domain-containing protein [Sporolactobacillus sp. CQH2019]